MGDNFHFTMYYLPKRDRCREQTTTTVEIDKTIEVFVNQIQLKQNVLKSVNAIKFTRINVSV